MPYRKSMYTLKEWNELVSSGKVKKDFDYSNEQHITHIHHNSPSCQKFSIKTILVPVECPDCKAKLWDVMMNADCTAPNILAFFRINKQVVVCQVCHFSDLRIKAGELPK